MSTEAIRSDWVGRVIDGRFPLLKWLGGSDWAGVFLTELREDRPRKAAIKLILVDSRDEEALLAGWAATASLSHPHLMRLYSSGRCQVDSVRLFYTVTEYAEENLSQILPERPLTPQETREMLGPVLDSLAYLHGKGLVHGRLKPSNILVADDRVKLSCDHLRVAGGLGRYFPAKTVYDSPQGVAETLTPAADIWSLGVTLVEALTQEPPVWNRTAHKEPVVPEFMPEPFAGIARECLRPELADRCTLDDIKARFNPAANRFPAVKLESAASPEPAATLEPAVNREPLVEHVPEPAAATPAAAEAAGAGTTAKTGPSRIWLLAIAAVLLALMGGTAVLLRQFPQPAPATTPVVSQQQAVPASTVLSPESPLPAGAASKSGVVKGEVVQRVLPDVSQSARDTIRVTIVVVVRATVDASGAVSDAALEVPPVSRFFGNQAVQSARNWRFKPAQVEGRAVPSTWLLHFEFAQDGIDASADETTP